MNAKRIVRRRSHIYIFFGLAIAGITISLTSGAQASSVNLVKNGGFDDLTPGTIPTPPEFHGSSQINTGVFIDGCFPGAPHVSICGQQTFPTLNNWTGSGLVWVYAPGTADTVGAHSPGLTGPNGVGLGPNGTGPFVAGNTWRVWGPGTGINNGLPATSPSSGNFIALDADPSPFIRGSVSQLITGLVSDHPYQVTFEFAAAQAHLFPNPTNDLLQVSLCPTGSGNSGATVSNPTRGCGPAPPPPDSRPIGQMQPTTPLGSNSMNGNLINKNIQTTNVLSIPAHGFEGWVTDTFTFVPTSNNEVLSFLAEGNPSGQPPMVLLDGVSVTQQQQAVPEPNASTLLGLAFAALAAVAYRRPKWLCLQD